jgi:Tol biopolymer transport system component
MSKRNLQPQVLFTVALVFGGCGPPQEESTDSALPTNPLIGPGSATHPAVSPDGTTLAFMSNLVGVETGVPVNFEIYLSEEHGTKITRLTENDAFDADIAWAPDGQRIAYKSYQDGNDEIYVVGRDGSGRRNLTTDPSSDFQPHWSPDGGQIVFSSDRSGSAGLFILDRESRQVEVLLDSEASESSPQWSPDGSRVAFVADYDGQDNIYVLEVVGADIKQLTSSDKSDWSPRWSPDGTRLMYISGSFDDDHWDLYSIEADGSEDRVLVVEGVDSGNPAWHPLMERIYFGRYVDGESRLFTAGLDGSGISPIPDH